MWPNFNGARLCFFSVVIVAVVAHQNEAAGAEVIHGAKSKKVAFVEKVHVADISAKIEIIALAVEPRSHREIREIDHGKRISRQLVGPIAGNNDPVGESAATPPSRVNWVWENAGVAVSPPILFLVNSLNDRPRFYKLCETRCCSTVIDELIFEF